jgi:hypothetical protein
MDTKVIDGIEIDITDTEEDSDMMSCNMLISNERQPSILVHTYTNFDHENWRNDAYEIGRRFIVHKLEAERLVEYPTRVKHEELIWESTIADIIKTFYKDNYYEITIYNEEIDNHKKFFLELHPQVFDQRKDSVIYPTFIFEVYYPSDMVYTHANWREYVLNCCDLLVIRFDYITNKLKEDLKDIKWR